MLVSSAAVAVLALCFMDVWYALDLKAGIRGRVAVERECCVRVGQRMELRKERVEMRGGVVKRLEGFGALAFGIVVRVLRWGLAWSSVSVGVGEGDGG
eukprot:1281484-Alexandrium_andersonii.AAC.1